MPLILLLYTKLIIIIIITLSSINYWSYLQGNSCESTLHLMPVIGRPDMVNSTFALSP